MKRLLLIFTLTILVIGATLAAYFLYPNPQYRYRITYLGTLGGDASEAFGINNKGEVVGTSTTPRGDIHGYIWTPLSGMKDMGTQKGRDESFVYDINDQGIAIGRPTTSEARSVGYLWTAGERVFKPLDVSPHRVGQPIGITDAGTISGWVGSAKERLACVWSATGERSLIKTLGGTSSEAWAINKHGQIAGWSRVAGSSEEYPFLLDPKIGIKNLIPIGSASGRALDMNDLGQVVGDLKHGPNDTLAFLYRDGVLTSLGSMRRGTGTVPWAINNKTQVVGRDFVLGDGWRPNLDYMVKDGLKLLGIPPRENSRAFLWEEGDLLDLNDLAPVRSGWHLASANDINDSGQIVGYALFRGLPRAFLLTPLK